METSSEKLTFLFKSLTAPRTVQSPNLSLHIRRVQLRGQIADPTEEKTFLKFCHCGRKGMKWGKKKSKESPLSSSAQSSLISHVFPSSWLSKFKQMSIHSRPNEKKAAKKNGNETGSTVDSTAAFYVGGNRGRFYSGDDVFWGLELGEDEFGDDRRKKVGSAEWRDGPFLQPPSRHQWRESRKRIGREGRAEESEDKIIGAKDSCEEGEDLGFEVSMEVQEPEKEFMTLRRKFERKTKREFRDKVLELKRKTFYAGKQSAGQDERDASQLDPTTRICTPRKHRLLSSSDSGKVTSGEFDLDTPPVKLRSELPKLKVERLRKVRNITHVRVYTPRRASRVEIFRVKALEDMKRARMRRKVAEQPRTAEEPNAAFDSFAVVKCSFDPQKDFRDSMLEMIREKEMSRPEEMEELLACYLTLNSDEYHDLIIQVFKQVWLELDPVPSSPPRLQ